MGGVGYAILFLDLAGLVLGAIIGIGWAASLFFRRFSI
jgi:hypothetical protein